MKESPHRTNPALNNYRKQKPKLTDTFNKMVRILNEHIMRHEERMYKGGEKLEYDPRLATDATKLASSLKNVGDMYLKIQAAAKAEAELLTFEEELEGFLLWLEHDLGRNHQMTALRKLMEVQYRIEKKSKANEPDVPPSQDD